MIGSIWRLVLSPWFPLVWLWLIACALLVFAALGNANARRRVPPDRGDLG